VIAAETPVAMVVAEEAARVVRAAMVVAMEPVPGVVMVATQCKAMASLLTTHLAALGLAHPKTEIAQAALAASVVALVAMGVVSLHAQHKVASQTPCAPAWT
jgi:hypothetical protein